MKIDKLSIDKLRFAEYNPRKDLKPGDPEYDKLKASIEHFGYVEPVIVNDRTGLVVGGHQRVKVLKDLGYTDIEVVHVDLDDANEKALNIALNKISGDWDADKLEDLLRELNLDADLDVTLTGFDLSELDTLFSGSLDDIEDEPEDDKETHKEKEEELDELCKEAKEAIHNPRDIKLGDRWQLGNHVLLCGNSYDASTYDKLLNGEECSMVFTDPPYNYNKNFELKFDGNIFRSTNINCRALKQAYDEGFTILDIKKLEYLFNKNIQSIYICCCINDLIDYINIGIDHSYKYDIHVMHKKSCVPLHGGENSGKYLNDIEYILFFSKISKSNNSEKRIFNNSENSIYYRHLTKDPDDVEIAEKQFYSHVTYTISREGYNETKKESGYELSHATVKPLRLMIPKIAISSNEGDIVVDMFCGSGSTLIACEKINRRCFAVEFNPEYCNETIDRWEALTGQKAVKV